MTEQKQSDRLGKKKSIVAPNVKQTRKKALKSLDEDEELLKSKFVKLLTVINKETLNQHETRWVLLNMGYSNKEAKQILIKYFGFRKDPLRKCDVKELWEVCLSISPSNKWKRQCFDLFSLNKTSVILQDLEGAWDLMNRMQRKLVSHETLIQITKDFGFQSIGSLNFTEFSNLLTECNRHSNTSSIHDQ